LLFCGTGVPARDYDLPPFVEAPGFSPATTALSLRSALAPASNPPAKAGAGQPQDSTGRVPEVTEQVSLGTRPEIAVVASAAMLHYCCGEKHPPSIGVA